MPLPLKAKTSTKKILKKYRENLFCYYAPFFIQGQAILTEITILVQNYTRADQKVVFAKGDMSNVTKTAVVAKQEEDAAAATEEDEEDRQDDANNTAHL